LHHDAAAYSVKAYDGDGSSCKRLQAIIQTTVCNLADLKPEAVVRSKEKCGFIGVLLIIAFVVVSLGCANRPVSPDGYRVLSYEAKNLHWVILRTGTFDGKYLIKRLTVICSF
jgi:hypothetical protein